jgi:hypothetical protein
MYSRSEQPYIGVAAALRSLGLAPEDAVSVADIAQLLDVAKITATRYVNRPDFPEPLAATSAGRVWLRKDVQRWAAEQLPLPEGRPRKEPSA